MGRRLLFIAYEFPPKGGTQAQHAAKLALALAALGWDVTALTVADPPTAMLDAALAAETAGSVRIETAWSLEPTRLVQWLRNSRRAQSAPPSVDPSAAGASGVLAGGRGYTSLPRWAVRLVQAAFVPDEKVGWRPYAIREAARLHDSQAFDLVLASGPPFSAYSAARTFASRAGLPWVADVRDPIVGGYFFRPLTPAHGRAMMRFEHETLGSAAAVLVPLPWLADDITVRVPDLAGRIQVVPNGFDPADFAGPVPAGALGAFTVSYVGAFQASIRPDVFLKAVADLRAEDADFARDIRVRFVGPLDPDTAAAIERTGTADLVERTGFVTHAQAIDAMRASAANLLVLGGEPASLGIMTSKLPEYLAAGRPILALVPADGVAADIVRRARAGEIIAPDDPTAVADALRRLYAQWKAGPATAPDPAVVAAFDRGEHARRISGLLDGLVEKGDRHA
jgi:glycosyltransferase involved in cell wall biosynthesis